MGHEQSVSRKEKIVVMNMPNKLTILRVLLIPIFMFVFFLDNSYHVWLALAVFVIASFTDNLDGYLARRNNQITTFGKLMDPLADKLLTMAALICFLKAEVRYVNEWVVMIILARELIVTGIRLIALGENKVIAASNLGKAKTVVQFITIIAIMVDMILPLSYNSVDVIFWLVLLTVILTVYSGFDYVRKNWSLLTFK